MRWSLPQSENDCEWSVNDFGLGILGFLTGGWLEISINEALATFSPKDCRDIHSAPS